MENAFLLQKYWLKSKEFIIIYLLTHSGTTPMSVFHCVKVQTEKFKLTKCVFIQFFFSEET